MGDVAPAAAALEGAAPSLGASLCPAFSAELAGQGAGIFAGGGYCAACHGAQGAGTPIAPRLSDTSWLDIDGSYAAIAGLVQTGVAHPKQHPGFMPARGGAALSDADVCAVAAYVYSISR